MDWAHSARNQIERGHNYKTRIIGSTCRIGRHGLANRRYVLGQWVKLTCMLVASRGFYIRREGFHLSQISGKGTYCSEVESRRCEIFVPCPVANGRYRAVRPQKFVSAYDALSHVKSCYTGLDRKGEDEGGHV